MEWWNGEKILNKGKKAQWYKNVMITVFERF